MTRFCRSHASSGLVNVAPGRPSPAARDQGARSMLITDVGKSVIPFRPRDAKRVGEGCFYLDLIVWLSGDRIEMGDRVGFNYGCYVNGYGGLTIGDRSIFGPYS